MRPRAWMTFVAAVLLAQGAGCCHCCGCFGPRDSRVPPRDAPPEERIPPTALRTEGAPAGLPKTGGDTKMTGAYGGS